MIIYIFIGIITNVSELKLTISVFKDELADSRGNSVWGTPGQTVVSLNRVFFFVGSPHRDSLRRTLSGAPLGRDRNVRHSVGGRRRRRRVNVLTSRGADRRRHDAAHNTFCSNNTPIPRVFSSFGPIQMKHIARPRDDKTLIYTAGG